MGKKYIIELEDKPFNKGNGEFLYRVKGFNSLVFDMTGVGKLTHYTEPDLDAIRKEAYEKGVQDTKQHWVDAPRSCAYKLGHEHGLNDAWETVKKLFSFTCYEQATIFKTTSVRDIVRKHSASESIEKIQAYEQEKEKKKRIQVGDEVNAPFGEAIVVNIDFDAEKIWLVYADGHGGFEYFKDAPRKTGRHFPEIAEVMQKMKEKL